MKYIIPRGKDFYCEFVIKEPGASIPMDVAGMTGTFTMSKIGVNPCSVLTVPIEVVLDGTPGHGDPGDADYIPPSHAGKNGLISVTLTAAQTGELLGRKGFAEDGYDLIPTYSGSLDLLLDFPINVVIPKIYILDDGQLCLAQNP